MKYKQQIKNILSIAFCSIILAACDKVKLPEAMGDAGQNIVKIVGGSSPASVLKRAIDFVNKPTQILAVQLRRDVPNEADLNKPMTVVILDDTAAVRAANPAYVQLPAAWYTIQGDGVKTGGQGGNYTFTFNPGEFAKEILITIPNATLLNPSSLYGLGFTITSASGGVSAKISVSKSSILEIGAKNAYDGIYECEFTNYHPTLNAGYTGDVTEVHLITTGANSCKLYWPDAGGFACPAILSGGFSYFGAQEPEYTVNPATNAISVQNAFVGATTFYTMNSSHPNNWDPGAKVMNVRWGYSYVGGVFTLGTSREWTQKLTYLRGR